jgi:hypothetical protein
MLLRKTDTSKSSRRAPRSLSPELAKLQAQLDEMVKNAAPEEQTPKASRESEPGRGPVWLPGRAGAGQAHPR